MRITVEYYAMDEDGARSVCDVPDDALLAPAGPEALAAALPLAAATLPRPVAVGDVVQVDGRRFFMGTMGPQPVPDEYVPSLSDMLTGVPSIAPSTHHLGK